MAPFFLAILYKVSTFSFEIIGWTAFFCIQVSWSSSPNWSRLLLLSKILNRHKTLHNHQNVFISQNEINEFQNFIQQRLSGRPVSRIINTRSFWKKEFQINESTLDPRSDSETLIETIIKHYADKLQLIKILDLGSGSGCLGLSLLDEFPCSKVTFFDKSKQSLEIAKKNSQNLGLLERSKYINSDWKVKDWDTKLITFENNIKFDIVISNPPYIPTNEIKTLKKEVKEHDPYVALNGGIDGLEAYRYILPKLINIIKPKGKIFLEIGKGQKNLVTAMAKDHGLLVEDYVKDLSGVIRVIILITK